MSTTEHEKLSKPAGVFDSKQEYDFSQYDILPIPIEIFAPDGLSIYANRAGLEMSGVKDASLIVGKFNLSIDPVCLGIMGQEVMDRIFRGEVVSFPNFNAPVQDLVDRGVINEKPWEAATMDLSFTPKWDGDKFLYTICIFTVKNFYYGKPEVVKALSYIDTHWLEDFSLEKLSKAIGYTSRQLQRIFLEEVKTTPSEYYQNLKIKNIQLKLLDPNLSIEQAFAACGVDSRGRYFKLFKTKVGKSPSEFRKHQFNNK